jgi:hypothetical protein
MCITCYGYLGIHPCRKGILTLKNRRITVRLESIRVADYPGKGTHHGLFDFRAQNHVEKMIRECSVQSSF